MTGPFRTGRLRRRRVLAAFSSLSLIAGLVVFSANPAAAAVVVLNSVTQASATDSLTINWQTDGTQPLPASYSWTVKASNPLVDADFTGTGTGSLTTPANNVAQTFTITGLSANTVYPVAVAGIKTNGGITSGSGSNIISATTRAAAPSNVTVSQVASTTALQVSFTPPGGTATITGYDYSLNSGGTWTPASVSGNAFTISGLLSNTLYPQIQVRAKNAGGNGVPTADLSGTTRAEAPNTLVGAGVSTTSVRVSFALRGAADANIQYSTDNGATWKARTDGSGRTSPVVISQLSSSTDALSPDTSYSIRLRAVNAGGNGEVSDPVSAATLVPAPTNPVASGVPGDGTRLSVSFDQSVGVTSSSISGYEFSTNGTTWSSAIGTASPITLTGFTGNTTISGLRIRAINAGGASAASTEFSGTTTPGAPTIGVATGVSQTSVSVTFTAPTPGTALTITNYEYSTDDGASWKLRTDSGAATSPVVITTLSSGTDPLATGTAYQVKLRAVTSEGAGSPSQAVTATTLANGPVITGITASRVVDSYRLTINFTERAGATQYEYSTDNGATWRARPGTSPDNAAGASPMVISLTSQGQALAPNTEYVVRLRSNEPGTAEGAPVNAVTVPATPSTVSASPVNGEPGQVEVSFSITQGTADATVEFSTDGENWQAATGTTSPVRITGLSGNTTYTELRVRYTNDGGDGEAASVPVVTTVSGAPSITNAATGTTTEALQITFTLPSDPGGEVTTYQYSTDGGSTWKSRTDSGGTTSPLVITQTSAPGSTALTWGTVYNVRLRAVSDAGVGAVASVATSTQAFGPVNLAQTATGTHEFVVSGSAPVWPVSSPIAGGPQYTTNGDDPNPANWVWRDPDYTPGLGFIGITRDANGDLLESNTTYTVRLRYKQVGGVRGLASDPVEATTSPVAPTDVAVTPVLGTSASATVSLTQTDIGVGRAAISGYEYSLVSQTGPFSYNAADVDATTTSVTARLVDGLEPNRSYTVWLRPVNAAGDGVEAGSDTLVTYAGPPTVTVPTADVTTTGFEVDFTAPAGDQTTGFEYRVAGGTWQALSAEARAFEVTGRSPGTTATVEVRAVNSAGPGVVATTTASTKTLAPTALSATAGSSRANLAWTPPASSGAAAITNYRIEYSANNGSTWTEFVRPLPSSAAGATVTGLSNGTSYVFRVAAINAGGESAFSAQSAAVTPTSATAPATPVISSVVPGTGQVTVTWQPPPDTSTLTIYRATATPGGASCAVAYPATSCIVTGLTTGTAYTFVVSASNQLGAASSSPSSSVTPVAVPGAPSVTSVAAGNGSVTVGWNAPASTGGSAITGYTVTSSPEGLTCTTADTTCSVSGLTNGTAYRFTVSATNAVGAGAASSPSAAATPRTVPGAPTGVTAVAGNNQVQVAWSPPVSTGGAAITSYTVTGSPGGSCTAPASGRTCVVTGLTNATSYSFTVTANNAAGAGSASDAAVATPTSAAPSAPRNVSATAGNATATVVWDAPTNAGDPAVSNYVVQYSSDGGVNWTQVSRGPSTELSAVVTGLTNALTYRFRVAADNGSQGAWSVVSAPVTPNAPASPTQLVSAPGAVGVNESVEVTITGTNIAAGATVSAVSLVTVSETQTSPGGSVTVEITGGGVAGVGSLLVTNPDGGVGSLAVTVTPALGGLSITSTPAAVAAGATRTLQVAGTGIQAGATVEFPEPSGLSVVGSPVATTNGNLSVTVAASPSATTSTLTVRNPDGASAGVSLAVNAQPTATSVNPQTLSAGGVQVPSSLTGTGFALGALVVASGLEGSTGTVTVTAAQLVSPTQINLTITVSADASPGDWLLTITNRDGGQVVTTVSVAQTLSVSWVSTTGVEELNPGGVQGQTVTVTIRGTGFVPASSVLVSGTGVRVRNVRRVDFSTITATFQIAADAPVGLRNVSVVTPDRTTAAKANAFEVRLSG